VTGPDPGRAVLLAPLTGIPEVRAGADLAGLLLQALEPWGGLQDGDVLAVSSKVVSKALGLREPSPDSPEDARRHREEVVARSTVRVVAERRTPRGTTRVVEAVAGPVMAAAGVDASNTGPDGGVLLLPEDPDAAAADLHARLVQLRPGARVGVLLTDTAGRAWRAGQVDLALGAYGLHVVDDLRGGTDVDGRPLAVTERALADELAAAADLVKGKLGEVAAALVRGLPEAVAAPGTTPGARALARTGPSDWFALGHREAVRAALGAPPGSTAAEEVGVASVGPEPEEERGARAVRLALLGHPEGRVTGSAGLGYAVHATDPVTAGRVAARLEVALAGEDVRAPVRVGSEGQAERAPG
jgi:coenzyme F420-0:L-glutamate ligase/coenzyme F420-1:gamma-L-glutamate ligase